MLTINITAIVSQGKKDEFIHFLNDVHEAMKTTPGFMRSLLYQNIMHQNSFTIRQEWKSAEDVLAFIKTYGFEAFLGAFKILTDSASVSCSLCRRAISSKMSKKKKTRDFRLMA